MPTTAKNRIESVRTAFEVIDAVATLDDPGVSDIAEYLDKPVSTIHNHLSTIEESEYLMKTERDTYRVGFRMLELGEHRRQQTELYQEATEVVDKLAEETGDLANLVIEEHGRGVHLYLSQGQNAVQLDSYPGMRSYLHTTATGKTILAYLPESYVEEIIDTHGLISRTENTITDRETLYEELDEIADRGIAFDHQERLLGLRCVSSPLLTSDGQLLGAISVSGPVSRLDGVRFQEKLPEKVASHADIISINTTYSSN
jgi:DNA-binding IclR family transcriptional regulator